MADRLRSTVIRYLVAVTATAVAVLLRWLPDPLLGSHVPLATLYGAVAVAVWFGGYGPAFLATALGYLAADYFFVEPRGVLGPKGPDQFIGLFAYLLSCLLITGFGEGMRAARRRAEAAALAAASDREWLRTTLASVGDAVITTDAKGYVTFLNPVAQSLTGWAQPAAVGQSLEAVFSISNEQTRQPVEAPVAKVIRGGSVVGLANHTVLIARDGTERAIDDSAAPIRDAEGTIQGVILVFRDVTEKRRAERVLQESESRKAAILETALDCIITIDHKGKVVEFNPAAERVFGYRRVEVLGREMVEFIVPPSLRDQHRRGLAHYLATGEGPVLARRIEMPALRADGTKFPVELAITAIHQDGPPLFTAYLRDISDEKRAERRRAARLEVTQVLAEAGTVKEAAAQILRAVCESLAWDVGAVWQPDPQANVLRCLEVWRQPAVRITEFEATTRQLTFAPGVGLPGRIWATGQPAWIPDVVRDTNFPRAPLADREGLHGAFGFPLVIGSEFLGVIEFFSHEIREPDADLLEMMATIGSQVGQFMERKRAEESLQNESGRLRLLWEAASVLLSTDEPESMLRELFARIAPHFGLDTYFNYMVDDTGDALRLGSCLGIPEEMARSITRLEFGQAISGTVAQHRQPIVATYIQQSDDPKVQLVKSFGIRAYACHPLLVDDLLLGTLSFASRTKEQFDPDELDFLRTICHYVTVAYERLRLINQLRDADRRKDEFLATLSHELRNPLAPICNALQFLRMKGPGDPDLHNARDIIHRQVQQMTRLVDELLDVSRITRGKINLQKQRVSLGLVVTNAVESSRPLIEASGHELTATLPPEPLYLAGDVTRLSQVFLNLLNNAAKYTPQGGHIWLTAERQGSDVVVRVRDTGIGIPAEMLGHIFEMFAQVDRSLERTTGGLGIGLTLVRRLVEMHGGAVEAHSDGPGKGSEFIVRLPLLVESPAREPVAARDDRDAVRGTECRILVVDDNKDAVDSMAMMLRLRGHEVQTAYDGLEGVSAARSSRPDVVLLDLGMPRLNGYEVCRRIREQPWGKQMVLVALTGWGQEEDRRRTEAAGFNAHLVKPVDLAALEKLLAHLAPVQHTP